MDGFGALVEEGIGPLLDEVKVSAGERVLDVGTGPGLVAARAADRGASVVGVDFSDAMLAEARRLHPEIEFRSGSAEALPFEDGEFDAVVGNFVLHHSWQPDKALEEALRVLRHDGRMGFTVWADLSKLEAFGLFFAAVEEHAGAAELPHGPLFGVSDFAVFQAMARDAGFRDSSVRELQIAWQTDSIDSFLSAFRDWANLEAFPADVRRAIEATVREKAGVYRRGDVFKMPNPAILMSAVK
jgi:SAM-dependent methyltransferase